MLSQSEKTNPKQTQFQTGHLLIDRMKPKMSANSLLAKDYKNETTFRLQKNKPNQTQFQLPPKACPELSPALSVVEWAEACKTEVRCRFSEIRYLSSVHGHELVN